MKIRCDNCIHSVFAFENAGQEEHVVIWCDSPHYVLPFMVVDGLDIYLDELPDNWQPDDCPLEEVE